MHNINNPITVSINGQAYSINIPDDVPPKTTLLTYLREYLVLTGAKDGCSRRGECGACTVIVNGEAKKSCLMPLERLDGASVETIESLADGQLLHPLQWAFAEEGAVECGFCTPGAILAGKALLDQKPHPARQDIVNALSPHLCRCGMYQHMISAVQKASAALEHTDAYRPIHWPDTHCNEILGTAYPRMDSTQKVTGEATYGQDLAFEDMLFAVPVMPDFVHGEIRSIDIEPACNVAGVVAVLTGDDIPGSPFRGVITPDWPVFAKERVRFTGEVLAVVVAASQSAARAGAEKVSIKYTPLPVLTDPEKALREDAPDIHPEGNTCYRQNVFRGDINQGLSESYLIVDNTYTTQWLEHAYLETEAGVATFSEREGLVVYMGGHDSEKNRDEIARSLDLPEEKVKLICPYVGGSFGAKRDLSIQVFIALAAMKTGRPVKMVLTREESMRMTTKRHPMNMRFKTGFSKEGKIIASKMDIVSDAGAYSSESEVVLKLAVGHCTGPYAIPHIEIRGRAIYTNNPIGGAMRGYGFPQVNFAMESQIDIAAHELKMDPVDIRKINVIEKGSRTAYGQCVETDVTLVQCLETAYERARAAAPEPSNGWKVGIGLAGLWKNIGLSFKLDPGATANIEIDSQGVAIVKVNCHEFGQGTTTGLAQIAAQTLGIPLDQIRIINFDSSIVPKGGPGVSARQTFIQGIAVMNAAEIIKDKLLRLCGKVLSVEKDALRITRLGVVSDDGDNRCISWEEIQAAAAKNNDPLKTSYCHELPPAVNIPELENGDRDLRFDQLLTYGAHAAVVKVEVSTGKLVVDRLIAVHDVGTEINPLACRSQIVGGALMGLGQAVSEDLKVKDGKIINPTLRSYGVPTNQLIDTIEAITVKSPNPLGPYGVKGVAEAPVIPVAAAVGNAIYDAIGERLYSLPFQIPSKNEVLR